MTNDQGTTTNKKQSNWSLGFGHWSFSELATKLVNLLSIKYEIVRFEQATDRRFVQFHLESADADRAVADLALMFDGFVVGLNATDARRRHSIEIDRYFELFAFTTDRIG